jgi:HD superfamily phosphodiesterase
MIINFRQMNDYALMAYYMNYFAEKKTKELELIKVRSRNVLEHIERVAHHVGRL